VDLSGHAQQVWIFLGESDQWHGRPLSLALLEMLKRNGIAGGTVLRGIAGYGAHSFIHTTSLVELSSDLPVIVTFVDRPDRVARVMPEIMSMVREGLITTIPVEVLKYTSRAVGPFPAHLTVADIMSRQVVSVRPDTPIAVIVELLIDRALRSAPVVDAENRVVGIITDGDLLTRGATELPLALQRELSLAERAAAVEILAERPHTAADLMTPDPVTLPMTTPLAEAAAIMADRGLKRIPVVDEQHRLVGMVSRYDLLSTVAEGLRQRPAEPVVPSGGAPQTVGDIMMTGIPTVRPDTPLAETLDHLLETDKRRVVVVDEHHHVVGIISDGDVLRRAAKRVRSGALRALAAWFGGGARPPGLEVAAEGRTAADVMTSPVVTLPADAPITEAVRLMMTHKIKRIPVVDADKRFVGMVGRAGVLAALSRRT
jgi:CBS-domain-containing membrane protein